MRSLFFLFFLFFSAQVFADTDAAIMEALKEAMHFNEVASTATNAPGDCNGAKFTSKITVDLKDDADHFYKEVEFDLGRSVRKETFENDEVSVVTEEEAQKLFELFSQLEYLKFDYLHDGCFARAHELALIAKENGIDMGKVFLSDHTGRASLYPKSWKNNPDAPIPTGFVGWRYHVTPYVLVEKEGELVPFVFDVGVAKKSQPLSEWQDSLMDPADTDRSNRKVTYRDRGYIYEDGRSHFPDTSIIKGQIEDQELIREHGIFDFMYYREKGLL